MGSTAFFSAIGTVALFVIASIFLRLARKAEEKVRIHNELRSKIVVDAQFERERDLLSQEISADNLQLLDDCILNEELNAQLSGIDVEYRNIFEKHIRYDLQYFEQGIDSHPSAQLVIMRRAAARKNQKKAPMLKVEKYSVGKLDLLITDKAFSSASVEDASEARDMSAVSIIKEQPLNGFPDFVVRAMFTASLLHLNKFSIENDISNKKTPICYCLYDKATDKFVFFATRSVNGQTKVRISKMRDFSHML